MFSYSLLSKCPRFRLLLRSTCPAGIQVFNKLVYEIGQGWDDATPREVLNHERFLTVFSLIALSLCAGLALFAFADFAFSSSRNLASSVVGLCAGIGGLVLSGILWMLTEMSERLGDLTQKSGGHFARSQRGHC